MTKTIIVVLISTVVLATYLGVDGEIASKDWEEFDVAFPQAAVFLACRSGYQGIQNYTIETFVKCKNEKKLDHKSTCYKECMWVHEGYIEKGPQGTFHAEKLRETVRKMYADDITVENLVNDYRECYGTHPIVPDTDSNCNGFSNFDMCTMEKDNKVCKEKNIFFD